MKTLPILDQSTPFQAPYMPVLLTLVKQLQADLSQQIHSIYLNGSVAARCATVGESDINLTMVVNRELTAIEKRTVSTLCEHIAYRYDVVPSVDIRVITLDEVMTLSAIFKWGFWLKHCSVCLYGEDLASRFGLFEPSWEIAKAFNGDIKAVLADCRQKIMATKSVTEYNALCRIAGKKMLRSSFMLVAHRTSSLAYSEQQCADYFLHFYPDKAVEIERIQILIHGPQVPKRASLFLIEQFGQWIVAKFEKIEKKIG
ncbi:nucleotidyltransferase domain-containing protein [Photobacterium leiognathi]|uniref:nucleotidyltransferase domain-containing protein n=1 Tax=Photobacterium leiognathi TaxID=553611 RepID=UPI003AF3E820